MIFTALAFLSMALLLLTAAWVVYPRWVSRTRTSVVADVGVHATATLPRLSVVLATREPVSAIIRRVEGLLSGTYDQSRLEVIVALDASSADQWADVRRSLEGRARVVIGAVPGKSAALNAGVSIAATDLLLFIDTAQTFAPACIERLVTRLQHGGWGAVTGTLAPTSGDALMDKYWTRELAVREGQASRHSVICVTGCAYLMQRRYWQDMPAGLICDDLWSTYSVVTNGGRVGIAADARVRDPRRFSREQEYNRRLRTMTGLLQFVAWFPGALVPARNPMLSHLFWHKLMRLATPVLVLIAGVSMLTILALLAPLSIAVALLLLLASLLVIWLTDRMYKRNRFSTLAFAARLIVMPLRAMRQAANGDWNVWHAAK